MKTLFSLFVAAFLCVSATAFADDATIVANWTFPIAYWFPNGSIPAEGINNYSRAQAYADSIPDFDPNGCNFDEVWSSLSSQGTNGSGYSIAKVTGNSASDHGASDFTGAFKVVYDQNNIYVLLKYADESVAGTEVVELMWAPYLNIPAISTLPTTKLPAGNAVQAPYARYAQFGGYKANFTATGFRDAMIVDFNAAGVGTINWAGTNAVLSNNLGFVNMTDLGSTQIKAIYTIGFQCLTGNAYTSALNGRSNFNNSIWRTLNDGKGISFDIHVVDKDANDSYNTAATPAIAPQEYWWNAGNNDGYALTYYSGFLGIKKATAVKSVYEAKSTIFGEQTNSVLKLNQTATVEVYNSIGKQMLSLKAVDKVDLSNLNHGIYVVKANNEVLKLAR